MKIGDLVSCYGWYGVIIDKHDFGHGGFLVHWIHNQRQTWRGYEELEVINGYESG
jgi:hypothetical protein